MTVVWYPCGCQVGMSMYGEHEILWIQPCSEHAHAHQDILKQLLEAINKNPLPKREEPENPYDHSDVPMA